jgi:SepF-like predicted cell division protein (DUF552 family)
VIKKIPLAIRAERALQLAVYEAIKDHARTGDKVVIYRKGKVVIIPAKNIKLIKPKLK